MNFQESIKILQEENCRLKQISESDEYEKLVQFRWAFFTLEYKYLNLILIFWKTKSLSEKNDNILKKDVLPYHNMWTAVDKQDKWWFLSLQICFTDTKFYSVYWLVVPVLLHRFCLSNKHVIFSYWVYYYTPCWLMLYFVHYLSLQYF